MHIATTSIPQEGSDHLYRSSKNDGACSTGQEACITSNRLSAFSTTVTLA